MTSALSRSVRIVSSPVAGGADPRARDPSDDWLVDVAPQSSTGGSRRSGPAAPDSRKLLEKRCRFRRAPFDVLSESRKETNPWPSVTPFDPPL